MNLNLLYLPVIILFLIIYLPVIFIISFFTDIETFDKKIMKTYKKANEKIIFQVVLFLFNVSLWIFCWFTFLQKVLHDSLFKILFNE